MFRKSLGRLLVMAVCTVATMACMERSVRAETSETVTVTFALVIDLGAPGELSDFLGADTHGIYFPKRAEVADNLLFSAGSPTCDGLEVADTLWSLSYGSVMIVNNGGLVRANAYSLPGTLIPPEHSFLRAARITDVRDCWLKEDSFGKALVQDTFDADTLAAFFIVTAEFRVKN